MSDRAKIPIFVSAPTVLSVQQAKTYQFFLDQFEHFKLERRALGRSDYPVEAPLKEVLRVAKRCAGGIILGFVQSSTCDLTLRPGMGEPHEKKIINACFPTAWNNLEAGILFGLRVPLLIFREAGISGGIFDPGVADAFIHDLPIGDELDEKRSELIGLLLKWYGKVQSHYDEI